MSELSDPLVAADVDLSDFAFMPLDVQRLLTSETWVLGSAAEKIAALTLWLVSWHQIPAASLPDNDKMLAHLSQAGSAWKKVKDHALRGWVRCSDGRIYHPVVAEKANEAWEKKQAQRARSRKGNATRWGNGIPEGSHKDPAGIPEGSLKESLTYPKGQGQGQLEDIGGNGSSILPSNSARPALSCAASAWHVEIGKRVLDLMGVTDDPNWYGHAGPVKVWLDAGADPETHILPVIDAGLRRMRARNRNPRWVPRSLDYFDGAVRDAMAGKPAPPRQARRTYAEAAIDLEREILERSNA